MKRIYDNEIICTIFGALNKSVLHRDNPQKYMERKKEYDRMVKSYAFENSLQHIDIKNVQGLFHKFVFEIIKKDGFLLLDVIWKSRKIYECIKFKRAETK